MLERINMLNGVIGSICKYKNHTEVRSCDYAEIVKVETYFRGLRDKYRELGVYND